MNFTCNCMPFQLSRVVKSLEIAKKTLFTIAWDWPGYRFFAVFFCVFMGRNYGDKGVEGLRGLILGLKYRDLGLEISQFFQLI